MSEPDPTFERLLEFVRDERGFDYTGYRRPTLMRRFEKRMQDVGADDWEAYRAYLVEHPEEYVELFNTILINVTGFFRDRETWDVVAAEVVPRLLDERPTDAPIRIWSAGCASGEEPYTIAMLLVEALGEDSFKRRVKIYATDVDEDALAQARDAGYTAKQLEGVPPELRERVLPAGEPQLRIPERPPADGHLRPQRSPPRPADLARRPARIRATRSCTSAPTCSSGSSRTSTSPSTAAVSSWSAKPKRYRVDATSSFRTT